MVHEATSRNMKVARSAAVVALIATVVVVHQCVDLTDPVLQAQWRTRLAASGVPGLVLFVAALSLSILLYLPGWPFIALAIAVHGRSLGGLISYAAAVVAVCVTFVVVRSVGGSPLVEVPWPSVRRLLGQLESRPLRTVVLLRTITAMNAVVNYTLALSSVTFCDYALGSAIGLIAPILVQVVILGALLPRLG